MIITTIYNNNNNMIITTIYNNNNNMIITTIYNNNNNMIITTIYNNNNNILITMSKEEGTWHDFQTENRIFFYYYFYCVGLGPVPAGLDFNVILQQQKMREKQSQVKGHRQRHLSEPIVSLVRNDYLSYSIFLLPAKQHVT